MFLRVLCALVALVAALGMSKDSEAQANICWELLEPIWIPPTPQDAAECIEANLAICAAGALHCCTPTCRLHPDCVLGGTFVAGHWQDVVCEFLEPDEAWEQFLRSQLRPVDDSIPIIREAATAHIRALELQARALPPGLVSLIDGIMASSEAAGLPKFEPRHTRRVRVLSDRVDTAELYLPIGDGIIRRAIALDRLVILRSEIFDQLFNNPAPSLSVLRIRCGVSRQYREALRTMLHELIHVRQWDVLGRDVFLNNYLIEVVLRGYGSDEFEREANALTRGATSNALVRRYIECVDTGDWRQDRILPWSEVFPTLPIPTPPAGP